MPGSIRAAAARVIIAGTRGKAHEHQTCFREKAEQRARRQDEDIGAARFDLTEHAARPSMKERAADAFRSRLAQPRQANLIRKKSDVAGDVLRSVCFGALGVTQKPMRFSNQELRLINR
ncbi:hypothetical protein [Bradyrhizobium sp. STM 3809]|uniref:hypothetical protein n=1 Tax=Bradyrhizobium sp. STM 3809 TaxID=551936 RepID=UPI00024091F6|nr:hypothetical protein [Bradyrhizobium sp. STM 3809]CCE00348.1 hypothetical protein BRAS3809_3370023 [Bradyrhizobium sp. STM 3809]